MTAEAHRYGFCYADRISSPRFVVDPGNPNSTTAMYEQCLSECRMFQAVLGGAEGSWSFNSMPPFAVDVRALSCDYGCNDLLSANARAISNRIFTNLKRKQAINEKRVNDMHTFYGHLMSHDMHHSRNGVDAWNVKVPACDAWWDPHCTGTVTQGFQRFVSASGTGMNREAPLEPINFLSSWIDGNVIYGGDDAGGSPSIFNWLRNGDPTDAAFHSCHLKVIEKPDFENIPSHHFHNLPKDERGYPQFNTGIAAFMIDGSAGAFSTGNIRGNVDPGVLSLITMFTRYHNMLCDRLTAARPNATAESHFWEARKVVIALLQKIFYYEYIPALLGKPLPPYTGYAADENPAFDPYHTAAAMRYGHSEVNEMFLRLDEEWRTHPVGHLTFRDGVLSPAKALEAGLDPVLRGLLSQPQGRVDAYIIDYMVNGQFAGPAKRPWTVMWGGGHCLAQRGSSSTTAHGLFDLQSMNIQRGREQGLCGINTVRRAMGLQPHRSWEELALGTNWTAAPANAPGRLLAEDLRAMYGPDVDNGDFWVAGLAERRVDGNSNMGETLSRVTVDNWDRLRRADRFHFENLDNGLFTQAEVEDLLKTSLSDIIRTTTGVTDAPDRAFFVPGSQVDGAMRLTALSKLPNFQEFNHTRQFSPFFQFGWSEVPGEEALDMAIAAPTLGWIGIGFSDSTSHVMRNSDMVVGRLHNSVPHIDDMYSSDITPPVRDEDRTPPGKESITNKRIVQENGVTIVYFRKPIDSGDSWDRALQTPSGRVRVAFAFQPQGKTTLDYHGAMRGFTDVQLFEPRCPNGTYLNTIKMDCMPCPAGSYRTEDMSLSFCPRCPVGSFQPNVGSSECSICNAGSIVGTTTLFLGALRPTDCICPEGTSLSRKSIEDPLQCHKCGEGLYCPGGMGQPMQEVGYFVKVVQDDPFEAEIWECPFRRACLRGLPGLCAPGASGLMCAKCDEEGEYWDTKQKACSPCSGATGPWLLVLATVVFGLAMIVLYKISMVWGDDEAMSDPLELGVALALMLFLAQSSSVYGSLKIPWGSPLEDLLQLSTIFTLDLHSTHLDCTFEVDLFGQYLIGSLMPLLVILIYLVAALVIPRIFDRRDAPLRCWNAVGLIFQTFFTGILLHGIRPFILHEQLSGKHSIPGLPGVVLESPEHLPFAVVGAMHLLFYGGGFLAYSAFACWQLRARARLGTARGIRAVLWHRFVYIKFRPTRYYWNTVQLSRNTILALIPVAMEESHLQLVFLQMTLCASICVHSYFWPYKSTAHNLADIAVTLALIALAMAAAFFLDTQDGFEKSVVIVSVTVCFMACLVVFVVLTVAMLIAITKRRLMTEEQRLLRAESTLKRRTMFYAELQQVDEKDLSVMEAEWRGVEADMLCKAPLPLLNTTDILKIEGPLPPDIMTASEERLASVQIDFIAPGEHPYMKAVQSCMRVLEERLRFRIQETVDNQQGKSVGSFKRSLTFSTQLPGQISRLDKRSFSRVIWSNKEQEQITRLCSRVMEFQAEFVEVFRAEEMSLKLLHVFVTRMERKFRGVYQACVKDMLQIQPGFARAVQTARALNFEAQNTEDTRSERYEVLDRTFTSYASFMQAAVRTQEATFLYAKAVAASSGGSVTRTSVKHLYRILEKLSLDPKVAAGEEARTWDAARTMVLYETMDSIAKGVEQILEDHQSGRVEVVRVKERFSEPTSGGWSDILLNLRFPSECKELSKLPFEIQLAHTQMMVIRKEMGGHHGYAKYRSAKEILEFLTYDPETVAQSLAGSRKAVARSEASDSFMGIVPLPHCMPAPMPHPGLLS